MEKAVLMEKAERRSFAMAFSGLVPRDLISAIRRLLSARVRKSLVRDGRLLRLALIPALPSELPIGNKPADFALGAGVHRPGFISVLEVARISVA